MKIKQEKVFPETLVGAEVCPTMALLAIATPSYMTVIRTKTMVSLFSVHASPSSSTGAPAASKAAAPTASSAENPFFELLRSQLAAASDLTSSSTCGVALRPAPIYELLVATTQRTIDSIHWSPCGRMISVVFTTKANASSSSSSSTVHPFVTAAQIIHVESAQVVREIVGFNPQFISQIHDILKTFSFNSIDDSQSAANEKQQQRQQKIVSLFYDQLVSDLENNTPNAAPMTIIPDLFCPLVMSYSSHSAAAAVDTLSSAPTSTIRLRGVGWSVLPICNGLVHVGETECGPLRSCYETVAQALGGGGAPSTPSAGAAAGVSSLNSEEMKKVFGYSTVVKNSKRDGASAVSVAHPQSLVLSSGGIVETNRPLTTLLTLEALKRSWADGLASVLMLWGENGKLSVLASGCFEITSAVATVPLNLQPSSSVAASLYKLQMSPINYLISAHLHTTNASSSSSSSAGSANKNLPPPPPILVIDAFSSSTSDDSAPSSSSVFTPSNLELAIITKAFVSQLTSIGINSLSHALSDGWDRSRKTALEAMRLLRTAPPSSVSGSSATTVSHVNASAVSEKLPTLVSINSGASFDGNMGVNSATAATTGQAGPSLAPSPSSSSALTSTTTIPTLYHYDRHNVTLLQDLLVSLAARPYYDDVCDYFGLGTSLTDKAKERREKKKNQPSFNPVDAAQLQNASSIVDKGYGTLLMVINHLVLPSLSWAYCYAASSSSSSSCDVTTMSNIARAIQHTESLIQQTADERDDLLLLLQFVLQQKMKLTHQQRTALSALVPNATASPNAGVGSGGNDYAAGSATESLVKSMIPAEIPKMADTLVPIAAALLPQDHVALVDVLAVMAEEKAFAPHLIVSLASSGACGSGLNEKKMNPSSPALLLLLNGADSETDFNAILSTSSSAGGSSSSYASDVPPLWYSSCFAFASAASKGLQTSQEGTTFSSSSSIDEVISIRVGGGSNTSLCSAFVDVPPMLQYTAVSQRKAVPSASADGGCDAIGGGISRVITYNESCNFLMSAEIKKMKEENGEEDSSAEGGGGAPVIGQLASVSLSHNPNEHLGGAITVQLRRLLSHASSYVEKSIDLSSIFGEDEFANGNVFISQIIPSQSHLALVVSATTVQPPTPSSSWLHSHLQSCFEKQRAREAKKNGQQPPTIFSSAFATARTPPSAIIFVDRSTFEIDESLANESDSYAICLPADLSHPASTSRVSFNADKGLLAVVNGGNRLVLMDLWDEPEESDEDEDDNAAK